MLQWLVSVCVCSGLALCLNDIGEFCSVCVCSGLPVFRNGLGECSDFMCMFWLICNTSACDL